MTPRLANDQLLNAIPTMWDNLAQVASLAGRVESGYSFAHAFGCQASKRIARRLGTPEDGS
jgi:hypothetical protein